MDGYKHGRGFVQVSFWAREREREILLRITCRQLISCSSFITSSLSTNLISPLRSLLIIKVLAPVLGAAVILMIIVEFCWFNCCLGFFRSLLLSFAEMSQAFTFVICKKHCAWCYSLSVFFVHICINDTSTSFLCFYWYLFTDGSSAW